MTLAPILVLGAAALVINLSGGRWRPWLIFCASLAAVFALQPAMPIRNLDFWLPVLSLALVALGARRANVAMKTPQPTGRRIPATPMPLLPAAPIVPATCVPWPLSSL